MFYPSSMPHHLQILTIFDSVDAALCVSFHHVELRVMFCCVMCVSLSIRRLFYCVIDSNVLCLSARCFISVSETST